MIVGFLFQTAGYFTFCLWMNVLNPACCRGVGTWWSLRPLPIQAILCFFLVHFPLHLVLQSKPNPSHFSSFTSVDSWSVLHTCMTCYLLIQHLLFFKKMHVWKTGDTQRHCQGVAITYGRGGGRSRCDQSMENALSLFICLLKGWDALENYQGMWNHWIV